MEMQNVVVGMVACSLGLILIAGTALDASWLMELGRPRLLAAAIGKPGARLALGLIGLGLIALGIAIALGWRVHWS